MTLTGSRIVLLALLWPAATAAGRPGAGATRGRELQAEILTARIAPHSPERQPPPPAPGLPRECLTYEQRYKHAYHVGLAHSWAANAQHPKSGFVVLLQLHRVLPDRIPLDLVMSVRAMAAEVTAAGYHFYILYQPPVNNGYTFKAAGETRLTREAVLDGLPPDLRPFICVHDFDDDFSQYPALGAQDAPGADLYTIWGPGPRAAYTSPLRFMRRYTAYQYAWVVEWDVRWTGSSWADFLNAALDLGRQATRAELEAQQWRVADSSRTASRGLPALPDPDLADLLVIGAVEPNNRWKDKMLHNMGNASQLYSVSATVYLASRRLWDVLHDYSLKGVGAHVEVALPTAAMQNNLKAVGVDLPVNATYPESFHCCNTQASQMYGEWFNASSAACMPSLLLHPIKTNEAFWPSLALSF